MDPTAPVLTAKAQRTRAALMDAAREVIGRKGPGAVTVMAVCKAAKVGRTSFYNYFPATADLTGEIARETAGVVRDGFNRLHVGQPRGPDRLRTCLEMILDMAVEDPARMRLLTALAADAPEVGQILRHEIEAELATMPGLGHDARVALVSLLSLALLSITREIATGRLPPSQTDDIVDGLMRACRMP